jgi:hypothetical protein
MKILENKIKMKKKLKNSYQIILINEYHHKSQPAFY